MSILLVATPIEWVERVALEPLALLSDHAQCEIKAAASAQALIARHSHRRELVIELAAVAAEEMEHFARVAALLHARGGNLEPIARNLYAEGLLAATGSAGGDALLDRLLVSSLIEARSLERFQLLAEHLADPELAALYRSLIASEAAHHALFLRLARRYYAAERVGERLAALARVEAEVLTALPFGVRMHSGAGSRSVCCE